MHDGNWNDGMGHAVGWWIPMIIMMVAFWGGLVWIGIAVLRRNHLTPLRWPGTPHDAPAAAGPPPRPTAEEILAERLARGEIEPDEYRQRLDALRTPPRA